MRDESGGNDRIAIWKYGEKVEQICDFSQGLDARAALGNMLAPSVSEPNFYDALTVTLTRMQTQNGRKALLLISPGVDTFSKGNYEDALQAARHSGVPIYAINLAAAAGSAMSSSTGPYSRIDWKRAASELQRIATASGGRIYSPETTLDLSGVYDDLMENLRVRYVITCKSGSDADANLARTVRIELVDSRTRTSEDRRRQSADCTLADDRGGQLRPWHRANGRLKFRRSARTPRPRRGFRLTPSSDPCGRAPPATRMMGK